MQAISSNQREHLYEGGGVGVTITGETLDGTLVTVTEDDIIEGSFSIDRSWVSGSTIEIGCADTSELVFELDNTDGRWSNLRWEGTRLTVVFDIAGEPLQAGIFTVDEPPRKLTTMQIRALDNMARFNRPYDTTLPFPATLRQILVDACARCGVTLHTQTFENQDYLVTERPEGDDITFHHVVAWVAELAGCNAWMDEYGRLRLSWYGENQPADSPTKVYFLSSDMPAQVRSYALSIGPNDRFSYEAAEADIEITGIVYRTEETDYLAGSNKYALVIEENPLLQDNYDAVLSSLLTKLGGFKYRPYKFETLGYPHLWPGDAITKLIDAERNETASIITNHTYKLNGNSTLTAKGETEAVRGYATGAPFTPSQKRVLQAVAKVEAARQVTSMEQAVLQLNELMVNSLGFYVTTVELEAGAKTVYTHDKPALEDSHVIWTRTEQGFAWTDQGWNNGSPVWQYGITGDGNMIVKLLTARGIDADWVHIGGDTIIIGGFLRTELIKAKSIFSNHLNIDDYVKLEGTGLKIEDESGFLRAHHGQPAPGQFGSRWNHADGSYTRADAEGFLRYVAGANKSYHHLMHVGTGSITASNWESEVVITLPPEFKNKDFRVFAMISGYSGPDHVIFRDLLVQSGIKSQANGTMWVKGASRGNMAEGVWGTIDYLGESIPGLWFRATGGAMYSATLNFTYIAIA